MEDKLASYRKRLSDEAIRVAREAWESERTDLLDLSDEALRESLKDCSRLFLDPDGMSIDMPLDERLRVLEQALQKSRGPGYFPTSRHTDLDPAQDSSRRFNDNEMFERMVMREPDLRRLKYANKHHLLTLQMKLRECDALDDLLAEEISRSRASAEGWRYCLPKAALPFFAALHASRMGRNDLRTNAQFFVEFLDWLAARTPNASRDDLQEAARKAEDQFSLELEIDRARASVSQDVECLNAATKIELARLEKEAATSSERAAELADHIRYLRLLIDMGGGLDGAGNAVFPATQLAAVVAAVSAQDVQLADEEPQLLEDSPEAAKARLVRSRLLAKTIRENPMAGYIFTGKSDPESFVPARVVSVDPYDLEMDVDPEYFQRIEVPAGINSILRVEEHSNVLGRSHVLMLPPYGMAADFAKVLGWGEQDRRQIEVFGSGWMPSSSYPPAAVPKLLEAIRSVVSLRIRELISRQPDHRLADQFSFEAACEDLTRYWLFVLYGRHAMETFEEALGACYFHGVHGPDFIIERGLPKFLPAHFVVTNTRRYLLEPVRDDAWFEQNGLAAGLRRRIRPFNG